MPKPSAASGVQRPMIGAPTGDERARNILREFHAAEEELVGRTVVMSDGKAGMIDGVDLDNVHGLRVSIGGHHGQWPVSTIKYIQS
jgi:hypothetical protein